MYVKAWTLLDGLLLINASINYVPEAKLLSDDTKEQRWSRTEELAKTDDHFAHLTDSEAHMRRERELVMKDAPTIPHVMRRDGWCVFWNWGESEEGALCTSASKGPSRR